MIYHSIKTLVTRGNFDKESMMRKLDIFLLVGRINEEQYQELESMME